MRYYVYFWGMVLSPRSALRLASCCRCRRAARMISRWPSTSVCAPPLPSPPLESSVGVGASICNRQRGQALSADESQRTPPGPHRLLLPEPAEKSAGPDRLHIHRHLVLGLVRQQVSELAPLEPRNRPEHALGGIPGVPKQELADGHAALLVHPGVQHHLHVVEA